MILPLFSYAKITSMNINKELVKLFYEEVYKNGNIELIDELISPDFVSHNWPKGLKGPEGFKMHYAKFREAIPNAEYIVKEFIAEGERVMIRWEVIGIYQKRISGINIQYIGQKISLKGVSIYYVENDFFVQRRIFFDFQNYKNENI